MLKILRKRGKIAPEEQFLPLSTIFYYLMLDFYVKTGIRFSLRDKRLFEIIEVEITRVDCTVLKATGYISMFLCHVLYKKGGCRFHDFLFASLDDVSLSKQNLFLKERN